jgi:hypothetical protein
MRWPTQFAWRRIIIALFPPRLVWLKICSIKPPAQLVKILRINFELIHGNRPKNPPLNPA